MNPQTLELQGFTGISSGSGKERIFLDLTTIPDDKRLVALVGPNGAGKSTILDNLHPYRVMPSRSTTLGPGGFSYWDNISHPTAKKDLVWEHGGRRFRSTLTFKVSGKTKKADCYLFQWNDALKDWVPFKLEDGTLSDGKSDTYDRCIEGIVGGPESFFTSRFSAQSRKSLSAYGASEIKALLSSLLKLDHMRELSAKAAMVAKLLRHRLESLQDELSQSRSADTGIEELNRQIAALEQTSQSSAIAEQVASDRVDACRKSVALLEARRDTLAKDEEERHFLEERIRTTNVAATTQIAQENERVREEIQRLTAERSKAQAEHRAASESVARGNAEASRLNGVLTKKDAILHAVDNLPGLRQKLEELDKQIAQEQAVLKQAREVQVALQEAMHQQGKLAMSGKSRAETIQLLQNTASLIQKVPCQGSDMQKQCPLLANAHEANAGLPGQQEMLKDMRAQYGEVTKTIAGLQEKMQAFLGVEQQIEILDQQRRTVGKEIDAMTQVAAQFPILEEAQLRLPVLAQAQQDFLRQMQVCTELIATCDEKQAKATSDLQAATRTMQTNLTRDLESLTGRLNKLQKAVSEAEVAQARGAVQNALAGLETAKANTFSLSQQKISLLGQIEAFKSIKKKVESTVAEAERLSNEIAKWKLVEKGTGNDGLIALSIDDAGPEISMLCNSLLNDCYQGRFSVRLDTQRQTQAGNLKETFEVVVFDTHRGEEKNLSDMSGGERVWVNESLTRAIALYVGQSGNTDGGTLFTDEADGPLDPERKRQFMQMKRSVLERGGYKREIYITQTPELWELADHMIDVTTL